MSFNLLGFIYRLSSLQLLILDVVDAEVRGSKDVVEMRVWTASPVSDVKECVVLVDPMKTDIILSRYRAAHIVL